MSTLGRDRWVGSGTMSLSNWVMSIMLRQRVPSLNLLYPEPSSSLVPMTAPLWKDGKGHGVGMSEWILSIRCDEVGIPRQEVPINEEQ